MKLILIVTSFFFVGHNAYNKVGTEAFCNLDSTEFTAQCNYESFDNCQSYTMSGQRCAPNPDYVRHAPAFPSAPLAVGLNTPEERLWVALWRQHQQTTPDWQTRVKTFYRQLKSNLNTHEK